MTFTDDTAYALRGAAGLANTLPGDGADRLPTVEALDAFVAAWRWTGSRTHDDTEVQQVRALRPTIRRLWTADEATVVEQVNRLLAQAAAVPRLVNHDGWGWHLHATPPEAPLATRMAVEAAMALVDVVRAGALERLGQCAADDCDNLVVDLSRNRSRRYCESGCGNRAAVAAYRARRRSR